MQKKIRNLTKKYFPRIMGICLAVFMLLPMLSGLTLASLLTMATEVVETQAATAYTGKVTLTGYLAPFTNYSGYSYSLDNVNSGAGVDTAKGASIYNAKPSMYDLDNTSGTKTVYSFYTNAAATTALKCGNCGGTLRVYASGGCSNGHVTFGKTQCCGQTIAAKHFKKMTVGSTYYIRQTSVNPNAGLRADIKDFRTSTSTKFTEADTKDQTKNKRIYSIKISNQNNIDKKVWLIPRTAYYKVEYYFQQGYGSSSYTKMSSISGAGDVYNRNLPYTTTNSAWSGHTEMATATIKSPIFSGYTLPSQYAVKNGSNTNRGDTTYNGGVATVNLQMGYPSTHGGLEDETAYTIRFYYNYNAPQYRIRRFIEDPAGTVTYGSLRYKQYNQTSTYNVQGNSKTVTATDAENINGYMTPQPASVTHNLNNTSVTNFDFYYTAYANVTVRHWVQTSTTNNAHNSTNYRLDATVTQQCTPNVTQTAELKSYSGYKTPASQTVTPPNMSYGTAPVIDYYYEMYPYTVEYYKQTSTTSNAHGTQAEIDANFKLDTSMTMIRYAQSGTSQPVTIPTYSAFLNPDPMTVNVTTSGGSAKCFYLWPQYDVRHWRQNKGADDLPENSTNYTLYETDVVMYGAAGMVASGVPKTYDGYTRPEIKDVILAKQSALQHIDLYYLYGERYVYHVRCYFQNSEYSNEHNSQNFTYNAAYDRDEELLESISYPCEPKYVEGFITPEKQTQLVTSTGTWFYFYYEWPAYQTQYWLQKAGAPKLPENSTNYVHDADSEVKYNSVGFDAPSTYKEYPGYETPDAETKTLTSSKSVHQIPLYYTREKSTYTVNHWIQTSQTSQVQNDSNYTLYRTESFTGDWDLPVTPDTLTISGYYSPAEKTVTVKQDNSTVIDYYYTMPQITVRYYLQRETDAPEHNFINYDLWNRTTVTGTLSNADTWQFSTDGYGIATLYAKLGSTITLPLAAISGYNAPAKQTITVTKTASATYFYELPKITTFYEGQTVHERDILTGLAERDGTELPDDAKIINIAYAPGKVTDWSSMEKAAAYETAYTNGMQAADTLDTWFEAFDKADAKVRHTVTIRFTDENGDTATAVHYVNVIYNNAPTIKAEDKYITYEEFEKGMLTEESVLGACITAGTLSASDYEEFDLTNKIEILEHGSFSVEDNKMADDESGTFSIPVTYSVTDSYGPNKIGKQTVKTIFVNVVKDVSKVVSSTHKVYHIRFIDQANYDKNKDLNVATLTDEEIAAYNANGGLNVESLWYRDADYAALIQSAFGKQTAEDSYHFSRADFVNMRAFIEEHGLGNADEADALEKFCDEYMNLEP